MTYHMMVTEKFVKTDVLESICGVKGPGAYVGVVEKVTCPDCLKKLKELSNGQDYNYNVGSPHH